MTVSSLLNLLEVVYVSFRLSNMHSKLNSCPRPARKKTNMPLCPSLVYNCCIKPFHLLIQIQPCNVIISWIISYQNITICHGSISYGVIYQLKVKLNVQLIVSLVRFG